MRLNGRYNQVHGPFAAGVDLLAPGGAIDLVTPEETPPVITHIGIVTSAGTQVTINEQTVTISFGALELDNEVEIRSLIFPNGADGDSVIDFIY